MSRRSLPIGLLLLLVSMTMGTTVEAAEGLLAEPVPETVQFNRDIRPILSNLCYPVSYTHLTLPTNREV